MNFSLILGFVLIGFRQIVQLTRGTKVDDTILNAFEAAFFAFQENVGKPGAFQYLLSALAAAKQVAARTRYTGDDKLALELEMLVKAVERNVGDLVFRSQLESPDVDPEKKWPDVAPAT